MFWLLSAATLALGVRAQVLSGTATPLAKFGVADRLAQAFYAPGFYCLKTLIPVDLSAFVFVDWRLEPARFWPMVALGLAVLALLAAAAKLRPGARALAAILLLALAPSLGFFKSGPQTVADRFVHMASAALAAALAWGLTRVPPRRRAATISAAGLTALALAAVSHRQCLVWRDPVSLWSHAMSAGHRTELETLNLAAALRVAGRESEASALYTDLRNSRPDSSSAAVMAGDDSYSAGDYRAAAASYARALEIDPGLWGVRVNLGLAFYRLGRRAEAEAAFRDTVRMDPLNSDAWHDLGVCYAGRGLAMQAEHAFKEALRISPERADTRAALVKLDRLTHPRPIVQVNAR